MLLEAKNICFKYNNQKKTILKDFNLKISHKEIVGVIGSSGCGKSTIGKILSGYLKPSEGHVLLNNTNLSTKGYCPVQMIHQHPELSVNPRHKMKKILNESWTPPRNFISQMGINDEWLLRWPNELSGGELQRFCIARALGPKTQFLVCDEISTMLDVITQAQIWKLVLDMSIKNNIGVIVITHNIHLANKLCTRIIDLG